MMIRLASALAAAVLSIAATAAPAAQFGTTHNYSTFAGSTVASGMAVSKCHRVCVKTISHGPAAAPQCIEWKIVC